MGRKLVVFDIKHCIENCTMLDDFVRSESYFFLPE